MKKTLCLLLCLTLALGALAGCGKKDDTFVIGISQYAEHPSLDNCREGFLLGLADAGLVEGEDFRVEYQTPEGEALRDDEHYVYVAAWEYTGKDKEPELVKEPLAFETVHLAQRNYKD